MNIVLCVSYKAKPGMREAFLQEIESPEIQQKVEREEGCIRYEYYRSVQDEDELLLVEKWESEEHQAEHVKQPHMAALRELKEQYVVSTHVEKSFCI